MDYNVHKAGELPYTGVDWIVPAIMFIVFVVLFTVYMVKGSRKNA